MHIIGVLTSVEQAEVLFPHATDFAWLDCTALDAYVSVLILQRNFLMADPALGPFLKENAAEINKNTFSLLERIEPLIAAPEEKRLFEQMGEVRKDYLAVRDRVTFQGECLNVNFVPAIATRCEEG